MKYEIRIQRHSWGSKEESSYVKEFNTREAAEKEIERLEEMDEEGIESGEYVKTSDYYFIAETED